MKNNEWRSLFSRAWGDKQGNAAAFQEPFGRFSVVKMPNHHEDVYDPETGDPGAMVWLKATPHNCVCGAAFMKT